MSILTPNMTAPAAAVVLHNAVTAVGSSTAQTVGAQTLFTVEVSGTFVATVKVQGYLASSSSYTDLPVYSLTGKRLTKITEPGIYQCYVSGLVQVRSRVDSYTSGSVSVTGMLSREAMRQHDRLVELFHGTTASVAAGANLDVVAAASMIDTSGYVYLRVGVKADSTGDFTLRYLPYPRPDTSVSNYESYIDVLAATLRGHSELIEPKGRGAVFNVLNGDTGAHTYTVTVWGVR